MDKIISGRTEVFQLNKLDQLTLKKNNKLTNQQYFGNNPDVTNPA